MVGLQNKERGEEDKVENKNNRSWTHCLFH